MQLDQLGIKKRNETCHSLNFIKMAKLLDRPHSHLHRYISGPKLTKCEFTGVSVLIDDL